VFTTTPVDSNPKQILFNINCNLFGDDFNFTASKLIPIRQYPNPPFLTIDAMGNDSVLYNSADHTNVVYTTAQSITLSAYYPLLTINTSQLLWRSVNSEGVIDEDTGVNFTLELSTISACVTLSGISGKPIEGNFQIYNFSDQICFFNLSATEGFNYIAFPSNIFVPPTPLSFSNYNDSQGLSSYKSCHTELVNMSATPGFTTYVWNIGEKFVETATNTTIIPITYADVSATNIVAVSAFDSVFLRDSLVTFQNSASSDGSNKFRQPFTFLSFPSPSAILEIDNDLVNTDKYSELPTLNCQLDIGFTSLQTYALNIVLSSADGIQTKQVDSNQITFSNLLNIGIENTEFLIKENSYTPMIAYVSGNAGVSINGYDFCTELTPVVSNYIHLTAYNGPNLELYTEKNIVSSSEVVTFYNTSNENFANAVSAKFTIFDFDDGDGVIQTTSASVLSSTYATTGSKSPSLTGYLGDGRIFSRTWTDMLVVRDAVEEYNPDITREFYKTISMPYSLEDTLIKPNEWQYADTINNSLEKIKTNIDYLSAMGSVNNINFPKAYGGFLGTKFGNFKWHMIYEPVNLETDVFSDLKTAQVIYNNMIAINDDDLNIYDISIDPFLDTTISRIGDGEILQNPTKIHYNDETKILYILETARQLMFICDFDINEGDIFTTGSSQLVTNSSFDSDLSGWSNVGSLWSWNAGSADFSCLPADAVEAEAGLNQTITNLRVGYRYRITVDITMPPSPFGHMLVHMDYIHTSDPITTTQSYTFDFVAIATSAFISLQLYPVPGDPFTGSVQQVVCRNVLTAAPRLTHYWGGVGERTDHTKLNDPVDFIVDPTNNLFIVDRDAQLIKVYNKNLNWIRNIELDGRPISISNSGELFALTLDNGYVVLMDRYGNIQNTITVPNATKAVLNTLNHGILYIIFDNIISKYTLNGTYITEKSYNSTIKDVVFDENHGYLIFTNYIIKFVDFIEIDNLTAENETLSGFSWDSIFVHDHEFVTDYVYNDSFKKTYDNISILNSKIFKKLYVDLDGYDDVTTQYTVDYTAPAITSVPIYLAGNEPVLYDTINRQIITTFDNLYQLQDHLNVEFNYPSNADSLRWRWKYHYIDRVQRPSLEKNPVSWAELKSSKITGSTSLSSISSWGHIREGLGGNHSAICWNFVYTQDTGLFPITWADLELSDGENYGHSLTWADLEAECCRIPDKVFADCVSAC
jgi:hypothetical protein